MNYQETIDYLYASAPLFQNIGAGAYKEGLANTHALDAHFGHPHEHFKTVHIAGTNGKGSCAHTLAAVLQAAGYKVGLYTSPHLVSFRERIRVNGEMIPESAVINFVERERAFFEPLHPSFFELATAMAFRWFDIQGVDIAVVEVGLGGRLDCTNIITPEVSVITNISFDHMQFLGDTLAKIAGEKAGIIKSGVPAVIGEYTSETRPVFLRKAEEVGSPIVFAQDERHVIKSQTVADGIDLETSLSCGKLHFELGGEYQEKNAETILSVILQLRKRGLRISDDALRRGFSQVEELTGLRARWEILHGHPTIILDTGHNPAAVAINMQQLSSMQANAKRIVLGMAADKDIDGAVDLMPRDAVYYFAKASVKRAMPADELREHAAAHGLRGNAYPDVPSAYEAAKSDAAASDIIYVGGSNFVVGDFLRYTEKQG